jgi:hypothetical protein
MVRAVPGERSEDIEATRQEVEPFDEIALECTGCAARIHWLLETSHQHDYRCRPVG